MLGEQLSAAQEAAESARLALGESQLEGEQLGADAPDQDRRKLGDQLLTAQRSDAKLVEESQAIETRLRETERKLNSAKNELENRSGAKGWLVVLQQSLQHETEASCQESLERWRNSANHETLLTTML